MKKIPKLSELETFSTNPFLVELKGKMYLQPRTNTIIAKGQEIIDTTTGEVIQDDVLIGRRKVVDKSQFAKIYASEIGLLFELSKPAINVFMHLTKTMDYDNRVYFNYYKDYQNVGYKSYVAVMKAIRELIGASIIAKDVRENTYWLNPTLVCKGERFAKYTEYVTEERHKKDLQEATIKEQKRKQMQILDDETQKKINAMNKAEEQKYYNSISFEDSEYK